MDYDVHSQLAMALDLISDLEGRVDTLETEVTLLRDAVDTLEEREALK